MKGRECDSVGQQGVRVRLFVAGGSYVNIKSSEDEVRSKAKGRVVFPHNSGGGSEFMLEAG